MDINTETVGLTTKDALIKLVTEVEQVVKQFEHSQKSR